MSRIEAVRETVDRLLIGIGDDLDRRYAIVHLYGVSAAAALLARSRGLDEELAATAGMLHDLSSYEIGESVDHAERSARRAAEILRAVGGYENEEIEQVVSAIARHSSKEEAHGPFDELLKDADVLQQDLYNAKLPPQPSHAARRRALREAVDRILTGVDATVPDAADWVEEFYTRQAECTGIYDGDLDAFHHERAMWVERALGGRRGDVLELGCGGGQTAAAMADLGHRVVAIDLNPRLIEYARSLAAARRDRRMTVRLGDFYRIEVEGTFDLICYFDGFGVGSDEDQHWLLKRMSRWLRPDGAALIDVYTPWYWAKTAGQTMEWNAARRRQAFDGEACRMLDTWWRIDEPDRTVTQSLRCYSPADLRLLLRGTGLELADVLPGGAVDPETGDYTSQVPLDQAMSYLATLKPEGASRNDL